MPLTNTTDRYGAISITLHWLTAFLILTLMPLGMVAKRLPYETPEQLAQTAWLFSVHKTLGITVFLVALARIIWSISQPKPGPLHPDRKMENFVAQTVHWLLYGSIVLVPLSGWVHHGATSGFAPIWWPLGQNLPLVPKSENVAAAFLGAHWVLTKVLGLSILLHMAGALKHHVIDKDATLRRMWFSSTQAPKTTGTHKHAAPFLAALAIWALALTGGIASGVFNPHDKQRSETLEEVHSQWQVQDGALTITTTLFGSEIAGTFADWTAAISFDETIMNGVAGTVDVTIAIPSLVLGSVTDQAMGPDYFNARDFPNANFIADILPVVDGYEAQGTLTIRDQSVPVSLAFGMSVKDDSASMRGGLKLDRRDFAIGANMADEGSLKFAVDVDVELTAIRVP